MSKRWAWATLAVVAAVIAIGGTAARLDARAVEVMERMEVMVYVVKDLPVWHVGKADEAPTFDSSLIVAHIRAITGPGAWMEGAIEVHPKTASLVIRTTEANQRLIGDALTDLRAERKADVRDAERQRLR